jgi:hypothetical protein
MKQRHFQIELVNSPCCYNSVGSFIKTNLTYWIIRSSLTRQLM